LKALDLENIKFSYILQKKRDSTERYLNNRIIFRYSMKMLDELDMRILELLEKKENVSVEISRIAREVERPITTIHYRIQRLEERNVLQGFKPLIQIV